MLKTRSFLGAVLLGTTVALMSGEMLAQPVTASEGVAVPADTCTSAFLLQWRGYFRTPVSDGRPGYKFYVLGVDALCRHDYANAIHLFKIAGSWGYKPAEYSLGVMYFRGGGVPADRPLGATWMELAAASGIPQYVKVRDLMIKLLTTREVAQMQQWRDRLEPTYGAISLRRARWQWSLAKNAITGSHLGHPMSRVGIEIPLASGLMPDVSMATPMLAYYRALQQSDDPYRELDRFLTGSVTVGSLHQLGTGSKGAAKPAKAAHARQPQQGSQQQH